MSKGKEIVAFALALIGWITAMFGCVLPMWKVSAVFEEHTRRAQIIWKGLWMRCVLQSSGQMQCKAYDSTQTLTSDLLIARDMTVTSIITALLPLILSIMGAKCTNCIKHKASKAKVLIISGVSFIIAGSLVLIPVLWTRNATVQNSQHLVLGASLYFGFAAAALLITAGVLLCCNCPPWKRRAGGRINSHHSVRMKLGGIALAVIGWILAIVTCVLPSWRVTTFLGANTDTPMIIWEGLWITCITQGTGQMQCKFYERLLAFPLDHQNAGTMTVISILTALLALVLFIMGTKWINGKTLKAQFTVTSGIFFIIAGILLLIPVSWTSYTIIQGTFSPILLTAQRTDLGASLCIGFEAAALLIIGGILLCCTCSALKSS